MLATCQGRTAKKSTGRWISAAGTVQGDAAQTGSLGRPLGPRVGSLGSPDPERYTTAVTFKPTGTWTALSTPFASDGIDEDQFELLIEFQIAQGINGLVPCGTTGESPTLAWDEHERLIELAVEKANGRVGVLAGTGSNNTAEAIAATRDAQQAGASAALLVDCYYNGPSSRELREQYYQRVLDAVPEIPLVPYIIPGRSGCALSAGDLALLHLNAPERVPAVKQATGDMDRMRLDRELCGAGLSIMSGDDDLTLSMLLEPTIAASGAISVMSNIVPAAVSQMVAAASAGDRQTAERMAESIAPMLALVGVTVPSEATLPNGRRVVGEDKFRNPLPVKTMMAGLGMFGEGEGRCRPPLGRMTAPAVRNVRSALQGVHERSPAVLAPLEEHFGVSVAARLADDSIWSGLTG